MTVRDFLRQGDDCDDFLKQGDDQERLCEAGG
jgi:hypothetical protein